jgi:hypothetical protein
MGVFDHHDRIRAARHHSAGCDRHGLATLNRGDRDHPGMNDFVGQSNRTWNLFGRAKRVRRHNGKSIDVRTVEGGHIHR